MNYLLITLNLLIKIIASLECTYCGGLGHRITEVIICILVYK